jgi:hypothetical protein
MPRNSLDGLPPQPGTGDFDWMLLKNGEWLKGDIEDLQDKSFSFDSDELDTLQFDWDDVYAVYSPRPNTCVFEDRTSIVGKLRIYGTTVIVVTAQGEKRYDRKDLRSIIPGGLKERDYWSGKLSIGLAVRRGNTNQSDWNSHVTIQRRVPNRRTRLDYTGNYGSFEEEETVNNQQASLAHDIFLTRRLYARAPSLQYYRDKFQNIAYRLTPGAGLGHAIIDRGDVEWDVFGGAGYQYTRFSGVEAGEDSSAGGGALLAGTDFSWELTNKLDLEVRYDTTFGLTESVSDTHSVLVTFSFDVWKNLDVDISLDWDRVVSPQNRQDGTEPRQDDISMNVNIGWEF